VTQQASFSPRHCEAPLLQLPPIHSLANLSEAKWRRKRGEGRRSLSLFFSLWSGMRINEANKKKENPIWWVN
jgi:hypothetical protein